MTSTLNPLRRLSPVSRQRFTLIAIALVFVAPMAIAWLLLARPDWRPAYTVNHGTLVQPPRPLAGLGLHGVDGSSLGPHYLQGKWTLVYVGHGRCEKICQRQLYNTRQVRLAQGKNIGRVQRLMILTDAGGTAALRSIRAQHPDLTIAAPVAADRAAVLNRFAIDGAGDPGTAGRVYVVDPLGNLMMTYGANADPSGMLKDLERLLKVSYVG